MPLQNLKHAIKAHSPPQKSSCLASVIHVFLDDLK